jgi:CubicO group peptidase (beta-lactamase class C family)
MVLASGRREVRVGETASLALATERLEGFARARRSAPGLAVGLIGPGGWQHELAAGVTDVASGRPLAPEALMQVASIGKAMTAVALLREHDAGRVDLDAPVHRYLPWLPLATPFGPIRLRHLLAHTAGIVAGMEGSPSPPWRRSPSTRPRRGGRPGSGPATPTSATPCSGWCWSGSRVARTPRLSSGTCSTPAP